MFESVSVVAAGKSDKFTLPQGKIAKITTGAAIPDECDAVVMIEHTELVQQTQDGEVVRILSAVRAGADIRPVGSDISQGERVLQSGSVIGPAEIGLLASLGIASIEAVALPRVAVLSSGDELVDVGEALRAGCIRDSNRAMLIAAAHDVLGHSNAHCVIDLGIARDTREAIAAAIERGIDSADVLVTSGGVSMGDFDFVKPLLAERGKLHFGRVLMKPGKPCTFATMQHNGRNKLVFALPGNPVSALVCFHLFVAPALRQMMGAAPQHNLLSVRVAQSLALDPQRPEYHRAFVSWDPKQK